MTIFHLGQQNNPEGVVVLFHGYGASAASFLSIAEMLYQHHPTLLFLVPDGIEPHEGDGGRQWFSLKGFSLEEDSFLKTLHQKLTGTASAVYALLKEKFPCVEHAPLILGGFSQGASLAIHMGLYTIETKGILSFSGFYQSREDIPPIYSPPIFWVHGKEDEVIPISLMEQSVASLRQAHILVDTMKIDNVDHKISSSCFPQVHHWIRTWISSSDEPPRSSDPRKYF